MIFSKLIILDIYQLSTYLYQQHWVYKQDLSGDIDEKEEIPFEVVRDGKVHKTFKCVCVCV